MHHSYSTDCSGDPENHSEGGQSQVRATQGTTCLQDGGGWWHPEAAGEVSPHCRHAGGKGLAVPSAVEQPTLVALIYMTCGIASSSTT